MQKIIINWVSFLAMVEINALANILPINGMNTGEISGFYPNYFVPAGFTFSIWGIIYLLLAAYCVAFSYYTRMKTNRPELQSLLFASQPFFVASCLLNIAWILAWHYLHMEISLILMFLLFGVLFNMYKIGLMSIQGLTLKERFIAFTPVTVYFGWITVATIANITAALVKAGWQTEGSLGIYFSALLILVAGLIAAYLSFKNKTYGYAFSIIWALVGVWVAQKLNSPLLFWMPLASITLVSVGILGGVLNWKKS